MTAILEPQTTPPVDTAPPPAPRPAPPAKHAPVPAPAPVPPVRDVPVEPRALRVLTPAGVRILSAALIGLFAIGVSVQPPADGANPVEPWWADVLNVVIQLGLLAVLAGVLTGRRWTVRAGLVTGASLLTLSATCPIEGHHVVAAWWFVQMAVGVAMTALPALVLRRSQAGAKAG
ncbi:MAG TPA: hypothetical protein VLM05_19430 [Mycobacteriales bacterium]|nr:hypothetical protein [Mycobacteriales bacterium]